MGAECRLISKIEKRQIAAGFYLVLLAVFLHPEHIERRLRQPKSNQVVLRGLREDRERRVILPSHEPFAIFLVSCLRRWLSRIVLLFLLRSHPEQVQRPFLT